jgi:hypothetical protein
MNRAALALAAGWLVFSSIGGAFSQEAAAPSADPAFDEARIAFEAMPLEERIKVQKSLVWAVPFNGAALGTFGKLTFNGIKALEKKENLETDGKLTEAEMTVLFDVAAKAQKSAKFQLLEDKKSGVRIGLPLFLLTKKEATNLGAKWQSADGSIAVEVAKGSGTIAELPATYERFLALPDRKVTYKLLKPDFFVITGENGPNSFYVRYAANEAGMRGFTMRYPTAKQKLMDRYVIAAANSFEPFPGIAAVGQPQSGEIANPPVEQAPAKPANRHLTAIAMADGSLLAPAAIAKQCKGISVAGAPAKASAGPTDLVRLSGASVTSSLAARAAAPQAGEAVLALSVDDKGAMTVAPGSLVAASGTLLVEAALQPSAQGAAIVDRQGQLLGIVTGDPSGVKPIAGVTPVARFPIAVLSGAAAASGAPRSAGEIADALRPAAVPLVCGL